ncbi:MAG TPA: A24 family peptidase [Gammaproteobacteria bacterium]|nr:A24 family peptidase [Gammaproteobacteria bacterium]
MEIFAAWPLALLVLTALVGLVAGSFLNVVAYRLPIMMELAWRAQCAELDAQAVPVPAHAKTDRFDLAWPPSTCPHCGQRIAAIHNVPVLSFVALRGRCAGCGAKISARYPLVEAIAAVLGVAVAYALGSTWQTFELIQLLAALGFTWSLLALTLIDLDHKLLPDSITLPLLWAGLVIAAIPVGGKPLFTDLHSSVIGAVAGYLSLWTVYQLFKLVTGKEGMGYGDFKLLAAIGAWLGWQKLPLVIILSAAVGSVVGVTLIVAGGRSRHVPIPFGPYLAAAGWIALLWGAPLIRLYGRLFLA